MLPHTNSPFLPVCLWRPSLHPSLSCLSLSLFIPHSFSSVCMIP